MFDEIFTARRTEPWLYSSCFYIEMPGHTTENQIITVTPGMEKMTLLK
jgi:hypothetical protein